MKQLFSSMFIAASVFAMAGLSSCSNENDPGMNPPEGEKGMPTGMTLTLDMNGVQTRADNGHVADGDAALPTETTVKTIHVYIYDATSNKIQQIYNLDATDATQVTVNQGKYVTKKLEAFVGSKKVYVGLNLTENMKTVLEGKTADLLASAAVQEEVAKMTDATTGFSMFCKDGVTRAFVTEDDPDAATTNQVEIDVERLVAKFKLGATQAPTNQGAKGTLTNLKWVVDNIAKSFYMPEPEDGKDPNTGWAEGDFIFYDYNGDDLPDGSVTAPAETEWNLVVTDTKDKWKYDYSTENYAAEKKIKGMTRLVVRGTFYPEANTTYTIDAAGKLSQKTAALQNGSYYLFDIPSKNKPYIFIEATGIMAEGADETAMKTALVACYDAENPDGTTWDPADDITEKLKFYKGGANYWWVNMEEKGQEGNVIRNHVYVADIKSITLPGRPEGEWGKDDKEDDKLEEKTDIEVIVTVLGWNLVDFNTDLRP